MKLRGIIGGKCSLNISEPYSSLPPPLPQPQYAPPPQPNLVQRISGLIKSQLPMLQAIMMQVSSNYSVSYPIPTRV